MIKEDEASRNKSELQYQDVNDKTNRSNIKLLSNDPKVESSRLNLPREDMKVNVKYSGINDKYDKNREIEKFDLPQVINTGNPSYLEIKPYILQSPQVN